MCDSKPCPTPMEKSILSSNSCGDRALDPAVPFRQAVGSLMYLMVATRPDIAFAVGKIAQHSNNPKEIHWKALKRIFRYLRGTKDLGITYGNTSKFEVLGYSDSDWAGCSESRKSTEGYVFLIAGGAVSWRSKRQTVVATSSCEAEYIASTSAAKEALWMKQLISDLIGHDKTGPIPIHVENNGSIYTANNSGISQRNKQKNVKYHFIRECISSGKV